MESVRIDTGNTEERATSSTSSSEGNFPPEETFEVEEEGEGEEEGQWRGAGTTGTKEQQ